MNDEPDAFIEMQAYDHDDNAPVIPWSLDELDSDLDSVRSAWGRTDD